MRVDWIPVAERLPDEIEDVLVTVQIPDEGDDMFVLVGWWNAIFKSWAVYDEPGSKMEHNVIAWAPLPEPYEGNVREVQDEQADRWSEKENRRYKNVSKNEFTFEIIEHYGVFDQTESGWTKEVNVVSWNGQDPKIDIRTWDPDHVRSAKIGTLDRDAAKELGRILSML